MVGRLGTSPLAAIAMAGLFSSILMTFIWPVSVGVQALSSRRYGRYRKDSSRQDGEQLAAFTGNTLDNGIFVGLLMGGIAFVFSFTASFWLYFLIKDPALTPLSLTYISIIKWGLPLGGIMMAIIGFLSGINKTKYVMAANVGGSLLNIALNYLFIFGKLGFPAMGMAGAAVGTVISELIQLLYLIGAVVFVKDIKIYRVLRFKNPDPVMMKNITAVFIPLAVQNIFALAIFLIYESFVGRIGTVYLAATHVVFSVFRINKIIVGGFARGSAILIGNSLGADCLDNAVNLVHGAAKISGVLGAAILSLVLLSPAVVVSVFTSDPEVIKIGIKAMHFFAVFFFIEVLGYTLEIIFGGIGWGRYVLFSESTTNIVFILGTTLFLVYFFPGMGIYAAWIGFAGYQIGHAVILFIGYLSGRWLKVNVENNL